MPLTVLKNAIIPACKDHGHALKAFTQSYRDGHAQDAPVMAAYIHAQPVPESWLNLPLTYRHTTSDNFRCACFVVPQGLLT